VVTFATASSDPRTTWCVILTIEGHGVGTATDGLYRYCTQVPDYATGDALYRPWFREGAWPDSLSEKVDPRGGVVKGGGLNVELIDIDDQLTADFAVDVDPETRLAANVTSTTATSLTFDDGSGIAVDDVIFIGVEAMRVTVKPTTDTATVERGHLDTDATIHNSGASVYTSLPFLRGRRMRLKLVPLDGDSATEETLIRTAHVDRYPLLDDMSGYRLEGRGQSRYLDRQVAAHRSAIFEVWAQEPARDMLRIVPVFWAPHLTLTAHFSGLDPWLDGEAYLLVGDEVLKVDITYSKWSPMIIERGQLGTKAGVNFPPVGAPAFFVAGADPDGPGWFRYSAGPSAETTRNGGTGWTKSAHFIDLLLCLLTSSAHPANDDGLELSNFDDTYGNWSCLPAGMGLGIPHTAIDWESFLDVRDGRSPGFEFPNFFIGDHPIPFAKLATDHFLRLMAAYLSTSDGKITFRMPRHPLKNESFTTWTSADYDANKVGDRVYETVMRAAQDTSHLTSAVTIKTRNRTGHPVELTFRDSDYENLASHGGWYSVAESTLEIEAPSARADSSGVLPFAERMALRHLWRFRRALWELETATSVEHYDVRIGDTIGQTHDQLPDLSAGTRGWTAVPLEVVGRELAISKKRAGFRWKLLGNAPGMRFGRVPPSAYVSSVSGAGPYTVTVDANRYTSSDARGGLPTTDADGFRAADVVKILDLDGTEADSGTQIVNSIGTNQIVIDGNFSGNLASGQVLAFADRADAVTAQHDYFVYWSNGSVIGATSDLPWHYGEL